MDQIKSWNHSYIGKGYSPTPESAGRTQVVGYT